MVTGKKSEKSNKKCWNCGGHNVKKVMCASCKRQHKACHSWICQDCGENVTDWTHDR